MMHDTTNSRGGIRANPKDKDEKSRWILHWFYLRQEVLRVPRSANIYELSKLVSLQRQKRLRDPESWSAPKKSLDHLLSQRLLLIALRSPSDQFQVVTFPLMCE